MNIESTEIDDEVVCEVVGCQSKAKVEVRLKFGAKRILPLFFCDNCKRKFFTAGHNDLEVISIG
jgi:hypothetical protein